MKIFVINMRSAGDRRLNAAAQLRSAGADFEFFTAVDCPDEAMAHFLDYDEHRFLLRTGRTAAGGEIGCYASHLRLWKRIVASGSPALILEDDVTLAPGFAAALRRAEALIGRYGYLRLQEERRGKKVRLESAGEFAVHRFTKMPHGAAGYLLHPSVAAAFIAHSTSLKAPVDVFVKRFWCHGQTLYGLTPYVVCESALAATSTIEGRHKQPKNGRIAAARLAGRVEDAMRRMRFNLAPRTPLQNNRPT